MRKVFIWLFKPARIRCKKHESLIQSSDCRSRSHIAWRHCKVERAKICTCIWLRATMFPYKFKVNFSDKSLVDKNIYLYLSIELVENQFPPDWFYSRRERAGSVNFRRPIPPNWRWYLQERTTIKFKVRWKYHLLSSKHFLPARDGWSFIWATFVAAIVVRPSTQEWPYCSFSNNFPAFLDRPASSSEVSPVHVV